MVPAVQVTDDVNSMYVGDSPGAVCPSDGRQASTCEGRRPDRCVRQGEAEDCALRMYCQREPCLISRLGRILLSVLDS